MSNTISFRVITDLSEAKQLWIQLSSHKSIDDNWDFRYAFSKYLRFDLHFIAGYHNNEVIGLLPLQYNTLQGLQPPYSDGSQPFLELFGGDDTDENEVLLRPGYEEYKQLFINQIDKPSYLAPMNSVDNDSFHFYTNKYVLDLKNIINSQTYIDATFSGKSKNTLKRQIKRLYTDHKIIIAEGDSTDLELLFDLNIARFGKESSFNYPYRKQIYYDLLNLFDVSITTIIVDGKKEAVSYGINYKNTYIEMNHGVNMEIDNLSKLLTLAQIDRAIALKCTSIDAGKGDSGWKERFKFTPIPQYQIAIN